VERQLNNPLLTPSERNALAAVPVAIYNSAPVTDAAAVLGADPIASASCTGKDIFGITVWTYSSYVGFSVHEGLITNLSTPNDYFNSSYGYSVSQPSWQTSQPGPPIASMTAQDGTNLMLASVPYGVITIEYHFYGSGNWTAYCG
jgi:hypothetical protein